MHMKHRTRGFTLIEILVAIAIIGILASVVLASLNSARDKGVNSAVRQNIEGIRAQAPLYYDEAGGTYEVDGDTNSVCINDAEATPKGGAHLVAAADAVNGAGAVDCNDESEAWAAAGQYVGDDSGEYYCTDSTGFAGTLMGNVGGTSAGDFETDDTSCE